MFGRTLRQKYTYYSCQPRERVAPEGHPTIVEVLLAFVTEFFNRHLPGPDRMRLAMRSVDVAVRQAVEEHSRRVAATRRSVADITARRTRLLRVLEEADDLDGGMLNEIKERRLQLDEDLAAKTAELSSLEVNKPANTADDVELLADLPEMEIDLHDGARFDYFDGRP